MRWTTAHLSWVNGVVLSGLVALAALLPLHAVRAQGAVGGATVSAPVGAFTGATAAPAATGAGAGTMGAAGPAGMPAATGAALPGADAANARGADRVDTLGNRSGSDRADARSAAAEARADAERTTLARELPALGTTEYQNFVAEATGRQFPLFGYNLFASGGGYQSLRDVPVPADYVLGPGDEVRLSLWGAVDGDLRLTVDRNGQVNIPKVGTVLLAGVRASQLAHVLRQRIGRVYNNFQVDATLGQLRSMQVFVVGQARRPGSYQVSSLSTLISALFEVGGPSANGSMRNIQLKRDGRVVSRIDLYKFITEGDKSADAKLLPGDVIVIPPAGPRVALIGALDTQAIYELAAPEEPLGRVLSYGGRTLSMTSPHKVQVERIDPQRIKAPRLVESRALDANGLRSTVRDGDVVTLFKISPEFGNAVTLRGNVAAPLRYPHRPGMRVADLIPERDALIQADYYMRRNVLVQYESGKAVSDGRVAGEMKNLLEEINWDYAAIERLDPKEIRSQLIPFNLSRAVRDRNPADNLELLPGDVVTIFGVNDIPVPVEKRSQFVRVSGEVKVPGVYQLTPGETLAQVVARAGGVTDNAYVYGTVFSRESTRQQQQKNLELAIRKLEADIASQGASNLQNQRGQDSTKADAALQAQMASQRAALNRLQALKANGRVALELDPKTRNLPALTLEDGDQIHVPTQPSFVGVFGAVMAETSFLHRPNYTVRDYLDKAGITRDADEDYVLILRGDGSVETDTSQGRSWLALGASSVMAKRLNPGDSVFVPEKVDRRTGYTRFIENAKDWTSIFYQFGLGAAGLKVLKN